MPAKKYKVTLETHEREYLHQLISRGKVAARKLTHARILLACEESDEEREAKLITIACSKPPQGRCRWSVRLLADRLVELEVFESISHETVRHV